MLDNISRSRNQLGFTITELAASVVILGILMIPMSVITIDYVGNMIARSAEAQLATESQTLLRTVVEELRTASAVKPTNANADPNGPSGGWSTSNANLILITSTPALNSSREFIINPLTSQPYQNEIVYFATGSTLSRRTLVDPSAPGNVTKTSCPAASASPSCPKDKILTQNFTDMNFVLYDQDDAVTSAISDSRSLVVTVKMTKKTFGKDIEFQNTMRMTMRNKL